MRSIALIAAAPLVFLPACVNQAMERPALQGSDTVVKTEVSRVCPNPTTDARKAEILLELEKLSGAGILGDIDVLATEWERLDAGARKCKES